ncbi:MAG TPA: serine/threonine-protein kinase [Labilithrix sp.]|nr:serine/threonine-protein kinase [Labilithrix sp.]
MTEARALLAPGKQITKAVSLLEPLGAGGMGAVWLADHHGLKTRVVVKFMLVGLDSSESARLRFSREAAAAAQVKSPHVVQMLDHGVSDDGVPFIVMEHLEGHDLAHEIEEQGALDPAKVVAVVTQVAKALSKVHAAGLLHRDIKPDNIFVCDGEEDTFVKLLDFGIAKSSSAAQGDGILDGETKTGQIVGTPYYMSPEQVTAQKSIDHRSDLWSLGVVAYEALTGQRPYDGPSFGALAVKIATGAPPKPSAVKPSLPEAVDRWFEKACAREAADRFSSAKEMSDALRMAFEGVVSLAASSTSRPGMESRRASSPARAQPGVDAGTGASARPDLAATEVALGRSEVSVSVAERLRPLGRSSTSWWIGGAVALFIVAIGGVVLRSRMSERNDAPDGVPSASASASASASSAPVVPKMAASGSEGGKASEVRSSSSASSSADPETAPATIAPDAGVEADAQVEADAGAVADAGSAPYVPTATARTNAPAPKHGTPAASSPPKASASAPEPPAKPPAKPASTEPDLF